MNSGISVKRFDKYSREAIADSIFFTGIKFFPKLTRLDAKKLANARDNDDFIILKNFRRTLEYIFYQAEFSVITGGIANHINKLLCDELIDNWTPKTFGQKAKIDTTYDFTDLKTTEYETIENIIMNTQKNELYVLRAVNILDLVVKNKPFAACNDLTAFSLSIYEYARFFGKTATLFSIPKILLSQKNFHDIIQSNSILDNLVVGLFNELSEIKDRVIRHSYQEKVDSHNIFSTLSERQLAVLRYLQNNPTINRRQYIKLFKVSTMTAFRDLNDLVDKKIIHVKGTGRGTFYELAK